MTVSVIRPAVGLDLALHCLFRMNDYGRQIFEITMKNQFCHINSEVINLWYPDVGGVGEVGEEKGPFCVSSLTLRGTVF